MATALKIDTNETGVVGNDIVVAVTQNPGLVLLDRAKFTAFYERMKAETDKLVPDVTTNKGRDEIRSMAARVVRSKTAIEAARLELTKEWRDKTDAANAAGKEIKAQMEALADEVRKPLTEWEEAEKARVVSCREIIDGMKAAAVVTLDDTADAVRQRGSEVYNTALDADTFGDMLPEAENAKEIAVDTLKAALARLTREEADRAELERLRAENEDREAKETAEREARELAEKLAEEERQALERQAEAARAEQERIATAAREAEERARREADEAAAAVRERTQREHDAALAAERQLALTAQFEAEAIRQKAQREEEARAAEAQRIAAETAKREADVAHRTKIKTEAKQALITCGADEDTARKIVMAVLAGEIPHVRMEF